MSAGGSSQVETSKDDELIRETAPKLGFVAGRRTTELGDAMRRGALYEVKKEGRYWEDKYSAKKVENAYSPPPKKAEMTETKAESEGEQLARAFADRDRKVAKWRLKALADEAEAAAVAAEERARTRGTAAARAKAAAALIAAKTAKLNYSKAPK
jgi:hypothetical protein